MDVGPNDLTLSSGASGGAAKAEAAGRHSPKAHAANIPSTNRKRPARAHHDIGADSVSLQTIIGTSPPRWAPNDPDRPRQDHPIPGSTKPLPANSQQRQKDKKSTARPRRTSDPPPAGDTARRRKRAR